MPSRREAINKDKELAFKYYKEGLTQKEISAKVGRSEVTISKWATAGEWKKMSESLLITRQEEYHKMLTQLQKLNDHIEEGPGFPDSKQANTQKLLTKSIKDLEIEESSIAAVVNVSIGVVEFLREDNYEEAQKCAEVFDTYIQHLRSKQS